MKPQELEEILFELDPAKTSCKENNAFDEYYSCAQYLYENLQELSLEESIKKTFWDLFLLSDDEYDIQELIDAISK